MAERERPASLRDLLRQLDAEGVTDYRRYDAVKRFLNFKARDKGVPMFGTFELTPLCNLDCRMCYVHLNKAQMCGAELLTTDEWKDIMQQAIDAGMMYARLTGGECLTYPGFRELYLYLLDKGIEVSILSNGVLMDEGMTDFLRAHPPAGIQITVYGADEDGYERVTGSRCFRRVLDNLRRLKRAELPLTLAVTPSAYMTDGKEIVRLLHEEGIPFNINAGLMQPREATGRELADAAPDAYVGMLKLRHALRGKSTESAVEPEDLPDPGSAVSRSEKGVTCGAGRGNFSVDWQGGMRPCNTFPCQAQSVPELGFAEAWRRTRETAENYPRPAECQGCRYQSICKHCVSEHAAGAPAGHASPHICRWVKTMVSEGMLSLQSPEI